MKGMGLVAGSVFSMAALSCAADGSEPGGYVLLAVQARQAGVSVEVGDHVAGSALPIAVSAGERLVVHRGAVEEPVTVARGELVYVEGAEGKVTHLRLGKEIAPDELRLTGEEGAAHELAGQLGARVAPEAAGWRLHTPDVFTGAAFAHVPERLLGAAPVRLDEAVTAASPAGAVALEHAAGVAGALAPEVTPEVLPADEGRVADLPAHAFAPAAGCTGVAGQWRGRVYSELHEAYYDFTLAVTQNGTALRGTVVAEFWDAEADQPDQAEVPAACVGQRQHVRVVETAAGTVDASGTMRFAASSWRLGDHFCGAPPAYSVDRFVVPQALGESRARAVASDDATWIDGMPVELTRVSCR